MSCRSLIVTIIFLKQFQIQKKIKIKFLSALKLNLGYLINFLTIGIPKLMNMAHFATSKNFSAKLFIAW